MFQYHCLNPIAGVGLANFNENYQQTESLEGADAVLVRSAAMHGMELPKSLLAVARAGAGVNNIPLTDCAEQGIVVFNTPGANANGVKELVLAGMLLASRDIAGGIEWVKSDKEDGDIAKTAEKQKKKFAGCEISGKKLGIIGLGAIGQLVANAATHLGMERIRSIHFCRCSMEPVPRHSSHPERGRYLPHLRLHHYPCAADGQHKGHDQQSSNR